MSLVYSISSIHARVAKRLINDDKHVLAFYCFSPVTLRPLDKVELKLKCSLISIVLTKLHLLKEREGWTSFSIRSLKEIDFVWWRCALGNILDLVFFSSPTMILANRTVSFPDAVTGAHRSLDLFNRRKLITC